MKRPMSRDNKLTACPVGGADITPRQGSVKDGESHHRKSFLSRSGFQPHITQKSVPEVALCVRACRVLYKEMFTQNSRNKACVSSRYAVGQSLTFV